ncbi:MAG: hypothetical protein AAF211_30390, partial [Myxococcota bacterium]
MTKWLSAGALAMMVVVGCREPDDPKPETGDDTAVVIETAETGTTGSCVQEIAPTSGDYTTNVTGLDDLYTPGCAGPTSGPDVAFEFSPEVDGVYRISTLGSDFDTVLTVLEGCEGDELACNDNPVFEPTLRHSEIEIELFADQDYVIIVDASQANAIGSGEVQLQIGAPEPEQCDDGIDNDLDGRTDCGDPACTGAANCCPIKSITEPGRYPTTLSGFPDLYPAPSCSRSDEAGSDTSFAFTAPRDGLYRFSSANSLDFNVLVLLDTCGGSEIDCASNDFGENNTIDLDMVAGQTVVAVIDAISSFSLGDVQLDILEITPEDCADGIDNDGDFLSDCFDTDDCGTAPACGDEVCDDGIDNDANGVADCADFRCTNDEACCPQDSIPGPGTYTFDTTGRSGGPSSLCTSGLSGPAVSIAFTPAVSGLYDIDTLGSDFDTTIDVDRGCGGVTVACDEGTPQAPAGAVAVELKAGVSYILRITGDDANDFGTAVLDVTPRPLEVCDDGVEDRG